MDKMSHAAEASDSVRVPEASNASLAAQAAAGSRAAFEELVNRYTGRLFHFLRSRSASREDLEDLVQETFLKAYRNIDRYDARWTFATWLYTVGVRLAISRHRAAGTGRVGSAVEDPECPMPGPQETLLLREEAQRQKNIWNIAGTLGPDAYEALWLRYAEEMPVKNIARTMGKTQVAVRALLHRSRIKLAKKLKAAEPQEQPAAAAAGAAAATVPVERKYSIL
jgi:RNA polymerase sigma-70 factor (ECF subfamily)